MHHRGATTRVVEDCLVDDHFAAIEKVSVWARKSLYRGDRHGDVVDAWFALLDFICVAGTKKTHIPENGPERARWPRT